MSREINVIHTPALNYDIFSLQGELVISSLTQITVELNKYININPLKDVVLDLSQTTFIDSSGIRLIINLKKRLEGNNKKFYLLKPSEEVESIITNTNIDKILLIINSIQELEKQMTANLFNSYLPYSTDEEGQHRLYLSCGICGSKNVVGYLIDQNKYNWKWVDDDPFPTAIEIETEKPFDFFSLLPVICLECFMCSIKIHDFNICVEDSIVIKSKLHDESKNVLTKSIKKRKKIVNRNVSTNDRYFLFPRDKTAIYNMYQLAEFCTRSISMLKLDASPFDIGYLNYLAICYADTKIKEEHINGCRTWFTQTLSSASSLTMFELSVSYFSLLISNLNLDKMKDASQVFGEFTNFINEIPDTISPNGISSPIFWYKQSEIIWKKDIESKSSILKA
ncbi:MAG: STAS domain-containing protein [Chitinispirillia bacterium]|jgi:anti-anti-sigma factor